MYFFMPSKSFFLTSVFPYENKNGHDKLIFIQGNVKQINLSPTSEYSCLIYVICVYLRVVVSNTYCVEFLICTSSSCIPCAASFSGLSIFLPLRYSLTFMILFFIYIYIYIRLKIKPNSVRIRF